jgi:hypothetical protein
MSTNPGVTIRPFASISRTAGVSMRPTSAINPAFTPMSAVRAGAPVPSTRVALRMTMSSMCLSPDAHPARPRAAVKPVKG